MMGRCKSWTFLAVLLLACCSHDEPLRDMVGYVPPTSLPGQPKRTVVRGEPQQVWATLVGLLERSAFEIDYTDRDKQLIIARYRGDPAPYVDCGSIVIQDGGALGQIAGAAPLVALNHQQNDHWVIVRRSLELESRIIIRLQEQSPGTAISTDANYILTKSVGVETTSGNVEESGSETVSFHAGERAEFSKGTTCQPNGALDAVILHRLPNIVGSHEIERADLPIEPAGDEETGQPPLKLAKAGGWPLSAAPGSQGVDSVDAAIVPPDSSRSFLGTGEQNPPMGRSDGPAVEADWPHSDGAASTDQNPAPQPASAEGDEGEIAHGSPLSERPSLTPPATSLPGSIEANARIDESGSFVDDTTHAFLSALDCEGRDWHYCETVTLTTPYRKVNIDGSFGLSINTAEHFAPQAIGDDLRLAIDLPNFPSFLHVFYIDQNGVIDQLLTSSEPWPADLSQQIEETGYRISGPQGVAMIVALASEQPLSPDGQLGREMEAGRYLEKLRQRFLEIDALSGHNRIAASHLMVDIE